MHDLYEMPILSFGEASDVLKELQVSLTELDEGCFVSLEELVSWVTEGGQARVRQLTLKDIERRLGPEVDIFFE